MHLTPTASPLATRHTKHAQHLQEGVSRLHEPHQVSRRVGRSPGVDGMSPVIVAVAAPALAPLLALHRQNSSLILPDQAQ